MKWHGSSTTRELTEVLKFSQEGVREKGMGEGKRRREMREGKERKGRKWRKELDMGWYLGKEEESVRRFESA